MHSLIDEEFDQLSKDRETIREIFPRGQTKVALPCNFLRMVLNSQKIFNLNKLTKSDIDPKTVVETVRNLSKKLIIVSGLDRLSVEAQHNATMLFNIHLRSTFCSKRIIDEFFLRIVDQNYFEYEKLIFRLNRARKNDTNNIISYNWYDIIKTWFLYCIIFDLRLLQCSLREYWSHLETRTWNFPDYF